jgi:hypothetical protein
VLRASQIQNDVFVGNKKIFFATAVLCGKRKLMQVSHDSLLHQTPELTWCDPEAIFLTQNSCRPAARHSYALRDLALSGIPIMGRRTSAAS